MDLRPYFFSRFNNGGWGFIAISGKYEKKFILIQEWDYEDKIYILYRICYTQDEGKEFIRKLEEDQLGMTEGPEIYCIIEKETDTNILSIWKPKENFLEISYVSQTERHIKNAHCLLKDDTDFKTLISKSMELLKISPRNINIKNSKFNHQINV